MTTTAVAHPMGSRTRWAAVVAGCAGVLALLGTAVATSWRPLLSVDGAVSRALYAGDGRPAWLSAVLETLTAPGLSLTRWLLYAPVVVLLLVRHRLVPAAWVGIAVVGVGPLTVALKELVGRVRPDFAEGGARYESLSFPSGHSSGIACLVTVAVVLLWPRLAPRVRPWAVLGGAALVVLVGFTRMWLGVHFLSDVLAGWALGLGWTLLVGLVVRTVTGRDVSWTG